MVKNKKHIWSLNLIPAVKFISEYENKLSINGGRYLSHGRIYCKRKECGGFRDYDYGDGDRRIVRLSQFTYETSKYCFGKN